MIRVEKLGEDEFLLEQLAPGAWFPARRLSRDELPPSIVTAMVVLAMRNLGEHVDRVGRKVGEDVYELHDSCWSTFAQGDDA
jgi:hypothetical protein